MSEAPTSFEDLKPTELYRSALEDFALPIEEADKNKKKVLLAAFVEGGVNWEDYVAQHPEVAPPVPEPAPAPYVPAQANTVDSSSQPVEPAQKWDTTDPRYSAPAEAVAAPPVPPVAVAQPLVQNPNQSYLIKMVRENPLFEVRGHRFTKAHPYAIMNAADADYVLTHEVGFRQATPSELQEFYG